MGWAQLDPVNEVWSGFQIDLTQVRIRKACELLSDTNYPIAQIAPMIGYEHSTYFFSIFKRMIGLTPAEYRRRHQKEAEG